VLHARNTLSQSKLSSLAFPQVSQETKGNAGSVDKQICRRCLVLDPDPALLGEQRWPLPHVAGISL